MIKLRSYNIQETRTSWMRFFNVPRVDYDALLDSMRYPLIWSFDEYLNTWLPAEVDFEFIRFIKSLPFMFEIESLPKGRYTQLCRAGLIDPQRNTPEQLQDLMNTYGHCKIQNLLPPEYCKHTLKQYYWRNDHNHDRWKDLEGIKRTSCNNMPLMRLIHQASEGLVRSITQEDIKTSYSFASAYETGTCLPAHTDRPQCVWNISLMLGSDPPNVQLSDWPIFIQNNNSGYQVDLEVGDGVLYSGVRDLHWRNEMPPEIVSTLGVFLHYVPSSFTESLD
jgi:hypothetical protein